MFIGSKKIKGGFEYEFLDGTGKKLICVSGLAPKKWFSKNIILTGREDEYNVIERKLNGQGN